MHGDPQRYYTTKAALFDETQIGNFLISDNLAKPTVVLQIEQEKKKDSKTCHVTLSVGCRLGLVVS